MELYQSKKLSVRKSSIHGWGVFAKEFIAANELLEEVSFIQCSPSTEELRRYVFGWPTNENAEFSVIAFGNASLYNSANAKGQNNATYYPSLERRLLVFQATKPIQANQEILTYYGDPYWNYQRSKKEKK